VYDLKIE
jgi:hypothetical protein